MTLKAAFKEDVNNHDSRSNWPYLDYDIVPSEGTRTADVLVVQSTFPCETFPQEFNKIEHKLSSRI